MQRVVDLPDRGKLIVATDFQGNVADFERITDIFEQAAAGRDGAVLVITGDLVHGPELDESEWPDYLGSFYHGDSVALLKQAKELADRHPGRVHYLLGNHEHAHVGGPVVAKFFPDEAQRLEELLGPEDTLAMRSWFRGWPFVAVAHTARLVMLHAAPHARIQSRQDLERLPLDGFHDVPLNEMTLQGTLGALLWARSTSSERAHAFLRAIDPEARVAIYGHDVARAGYAIEREPMLCVSTSFGCYDGDKLYFEWDLAEPAESANDAAWRGLRSLYPEAPRIHSQP
ncbi:metallophosphoesterase [Sorangium cellulosum]|uniref:metallophosphoesterase n=1 Tax=Sorangium cellulosum TaxID=56 RepID=UPI001F2AD53D|nr:metallophosphoesterase [Sorangium cellulosum]